MPLETFASNLRKILRTLQERAPNGATMLTRTSAPCEKYKKKYQLLDLAVLVHGQTLNSCLNTPLLAHRSQSLACQCGQNRQRLTPQIDACGVYQSE